MESKWKYLLTQKAERDSDKYGYWIICKGILLTNVNEIPFFYARMDCN